jgi:glycosyltransferase involved in cell wall biosynthesis
VSPLRLLVVSHTYAAAINHARLAALAAHSRLAAIAPRRWRDVLFDIAAPAPAGGYAFYPLPAIFDGHILRYFYSPLALRRAVSQTAPDLVCVEEEPASLALAQLAWLKRRYRYRLVCFTWDNIPRQLGLPGLEQYSLARCDGLIAGSRGAADVVAAKGFRGAVAVTPQLGVDPELFRPRAAAPPTSDPPMFVAGYIGRLAAEKGLETFWEAAREVAGLHLLWVGDGPLRPQVHAWQAALGNRLRVLPAVPHEQIAARLRELDVLVLPSHTTPAWKEQFGHVLIEAMACGVPVIGSDSGAIPEVIGDAGLIVPERDPGALRAALQRLQADPTLCARLGRAGRARVLARYTHAHIATANLSFFQRVLQPTCA